MRIAIDAWNLVNDRRGMGRYTRSILADFAQRKELDITLIVRNEAHIAQLEAEEKLRTISVAGAKRELQFDAVWYPWNGIRFRLGSAVRVTTIYDTFAFTMPHRDLIARWREQQPIRRALKESHVICTISQWAKAEIERQMSRRAVPIHVATPVPSDFWQPGAHDSLPAGKPYALVVAGPDARKNVGLAITAMEQAFPNQDVALIVAGTLREEDEAVLRASRCCSMRVQPTDDELRELYRHAEMVLVPSRLEGYGLMVIEAMACGAPVIAADASALPEAADNAAWLAGADDVDAWVTALRELHGNEQLRTHFSSLGIARVKRISSTIAADITKDAIYQAYAAVRE